MEKITYSDYASAMKEIIMYDSLTKKQIKGMTNDQLFKWDAKVAAAEIIRKAYVKQQKYV